ncbi:MAG TPA: XRE family transcriptional regulator, partial [Clostridiales bacterium]|nr:XRE family transcriptional regulator [Clostridiales bacterium]
MAEVDSEKLLEIGTRIKEMREIFNLSQQDMATKCEVSLEDYCAYENGKKDLPFTFIHKCALAFGIGITDLLEGRSAHLSSYTVTRKGQGQETAKENGIEIQNLAPLFRKKLAEPYWVRYEYSESLQNKPIHLTKHSGQEFDLVLKGRLKVQVGDNVEYLDEGDSIYYNSSTPHGMIAVDGEECLFVAVVLPGENVEENVLRETLISA